MRWTRLKVLKSVILLAGILAAGTAGFAYYASAEPAPPTGAEAPKPGQRPARPTVVIATDEERLQGTWNCVRAEEDGQKDELRDGENKLVLNFHDRYASFVLNDGAAEVVPMKMTFVLNPTARPNSIDLQRDENHPGPKNLPGIYELKGDTFRMCVNCNGGKRPTRFATQKDSGFNLLVFKRQAEKPRPAKSPVQQIEGLLRELRENPEDERAVLQRLDGIEKAIRELRDKLRRKPQHP